MGAEGDRGKRAGDYILGLMGETERERAERDLEFDPAFRDAVIRLADEMRLFDRSQTGADAGARWKLVAARIAELPQMRAASVDGRSASRPTVDPFSRQQISMGLHALRDRRAIFVALGLIAAFALGYLVGKL
jgi:anti-sigma-K factor RskA